MYAIASAIVLNVVSWISLTYSGAIERKQVAEYDQEDRVEVCLCERVCVCVSEGGGLL